MIFSEDPTPPKKPNVSELFDRFWKVYPKKEGRKKASENFARATRFTPILKRSLLARAGMPSACVGEDPKFIKWPQGWLFNR